MNIGSDLERSLAFIGCHINPPAHPGAHAAKGIVRPSVTLSRQTGSGAMAVARRLAEVLQAQAPAPCGWTVFDKNLVTQMLKEHELPERLARFIPEDRISAVQDAIEQLLGLHPPSETLIRQISETVLHLADCGHVILVGRAANVITRERKNVFHVRLVAPFEKRVVQVMGHGNMTHADAADFIHKEDAARKHYLKHYFKHDPDDVMLYDLLLNTARLAPEQAAQVIAKAVLEWIRTL